MKVHFLNNDIYSTVDTIRIELDFKVDSKRSLFPDTCMVTISPNSNATISTLKTTRPKNNSY